MVQTRVRVFRSNAIWAGIGTGFESLGLLALMVLLTKFLGAADYGLWSLVMVVVTIAIALFSLQLPNAMVRFLSGSQDRGHQANVVSVVLMWVLVGTVLGGIIIGLTAPWLARSFVGPGSDQAATAFRVGAVMVVAWGLEIAGFEIYRAFLVFRRYALTLMVRVSLEIAVALGLLLAGYGLVHVLLAICGVRLASFVVALAYVAPLFRGRIGRPDVSFLRPYLSYSLPFIIVALFAWFLKLSDRYVVAYYRPTAEVGIYSASYEIGMVTILLLVPLRRTLYPSLSAAWNSQRTEEVGKLLGHSFRYFTLLGMPVVLLFLGLADETLRFLTKGEFVDLGHRVVPVIAAGNFLYGLHAIAMFVLLLEQRTRTLAGLMVLAAACNLVLNLVLVPTGLGIMGAAIATLVSFAVLLVMTVWAMRGRLPIHVDWSFFAKALAASTVVAVAVAWLDPQGVAGLIGGFLIGGLVYLGLMYGFKAVTLSELKFLLLGKSSTVTREPQYVSGTHE